MAERLTPERLSEFDLFAAGKLSEHRRADMLAKGERGSHVWCFDPRAEGNGPVELHSDECHVRTLLAHIDSQQIEIDRLLKANDYLRGQIFRGPGACYCVCHNPVSSCGYCQHCKGDNSVGEFHRLRALLGEAREALIPFARGAGEHYHHEPCRYCRAGAVLAKFAKEKIK